MISLFFMDQSSKEIDVDGPMELNQAYYMQEVERPTALDPFTNIQPQVDPPNSMRMTNLVSAAEEQAEQARTGVRCAHMNTTVKAEVPTLHAAAEIFKPGVEKVVSVDGMVSSLILQSCPVSLLKRTEPAGGNVLGLNPLVSILILLYWNEQSDDEVVLGTARGVIEEIDKDAAARGTLVPYKSLNYASDFQDPIGSYGQENREKLQEASRRYDPDGLFQKGVPGGFIAQSSAQGAGDSRMTTLRVEDGPVRRPTTISVCRTTSTECDHSHNQVFSFLGFYTRVFNTLVNNHSPHFAFTG